MMSFLREGVTGDDVMPGRIVVVGDDRWQVTNWPYTAGSNSHLGAPAQHVSTGAAGLLQFSRGKVHVAGTAGSFDYSVELDDRVAAKSLGMTKATRPAPPGGYVHGDVVLMSPADRGLASENRWEVAVVTRTNRSGSVREVRGVEPGSRHKVRKGDTIRLAHDPNLDANGVLTAAANRANWHPPGFLTFVDADKWLSGVKHAGPYSDPHDWRRRRYELDDPAKYGQAKREISQLAPAAATAAAGGVCGSRSTTTREPCGNPVSTPGRPCHLH